MNKQNVLLGALAAAGLIGAFVLGLQRSTEPIVIHAELPSPTGELPAAVPVEIAQKRERDKPKIWEDIDLDRDGRISKEEYTPDGRWTKRFDQRDLDGDGYLTRKERKERVSGSHKGLGRHSAVDFVVRDKDADGALTLREFAGPPDVFEILDADENGTLSADEVREGGARRGEKKKGKGKGKKAEGAASPEGAADAAQSPPEGAAPADAPAPAEAPEPSEEPPSEEPPSEPNSQ